MEGSDAEEGEYVRPHCARDNAFLRRKRAAMGASRDEDAPWLTHHGRTRRWRCLGTEVLRKCSARRPADESLSLRRLSTRSFGAPKHMRAPVPARYSESNQTGGGLSWGGATVALSAAGQQMLACTALRGRLDGVMFKCE